MGVSVLILGVSGTGKSASLRNFKGEEIALVNVAGKPLPFKGKFEEVLESDNYRKVESFIKATDKKTIVVDDAQYLMGNEFMRRVTEKGFDKFSELAQNFWNLLNCIRELPNDKIVYLLSHIERDQDGNEKFKTMGKLIDQCINVEGMATIVLKTAVSDGQYFFITQNSGKDTVKSPMGLFESYAIDNDLKYVTEKIRNYYELGEFLSNDDIKEIDETAKIVDIEKPKRGRKSAKKEKPSETPSQETQKENASNEETPKRRSRKAEKMKEIEKEIINDLPAEDEDREVPFEEEKPERKRRKDRSEETAPAEEKPVTRRRRRTTK